MTTLSGLISLRRIFIVLFALVAPTTALLLAPVMLRNHGSELMVVSANAARPNGSDGTNLKSRTSERFVAAVNGEAFTLKSTDAGVTN